jgi:hypothetical protein
MTAGTYPYAWLRGNSTLMVQRRRSAEPVPVFPGSPITLPGLLYKQVLEAASLDGQCVPWSIVPDVPGLPTYELEEGGRGLMIACLATTPSDRPKLPALLESSRYDLFAFHGVEALSYNMRSSIVYFRAGRCTEGSLRWSQRHWLQLANALRSFPHWCLQWSA